MRDLFVDIEGKALSLTDVAEALNHREEAARVLVADFAATLGETPSDTDMAALQSLADTYLAAQVLTRLYTVFMGNLADAIPDAAPVDTSGADASRGDTSPILPEHDPNVVAALAEPAEGNTIPGAAGSGAAGQVTVNPDAIQSPGERAAAAEAENAARVAKAEQDRLDADARARVQQQMDADANAARVADAEARARAELTKGQASPGQAMQQG